LLSEKKTINKVFDDFAFLSVLLAIRNN
jgi:hypothetical protein